MNDGRAHAQGKIGDISTTGHPIYLMFGSMVGGPNGAISVPIKSKMATDRHHGKF